MDDGTVRYRVEFAGWGAGESLDLTVTRWPLVTADELTVVLHGILKGLGAKVALFDRSRPDEVLMSLTGRRVKRVLRDDGNGWTEWRWPLPEPFSMTTTETEPPAHTPRMRTWPHD